MAWIPIPMSINRPPEKDPPFERTYIKADTISPATTAMIEIKFPLMLSTKIQKTAAALEPEVTPIISGLAKG